MSSDMLNTIRNITLYEMIFHVNFPVFVLEEVFFPNEESQLYRKSDGSQGEDCDHSFVDDEYGMCKSALKVKVRLHTFGTPDALVCLMLAVTLCLWGKKNHFIRWHSLHTWKRKAVTCL